MSRYRGREIDDLRLWANYIEIPNGAEGQYWPLTVCPNPDHDTLKRHFQVNTRDGLVHCFAQCGISGTYDHAIRVIEGCSDREARKILLGFTRVGKREGSARPVRHTAAAGLGENVPAARSLTYDSYIPPVGIEYLENRGISASSIARFGIGWCPEELRVVIPGRDLQGQTRFLIKRAVMDRQRPKYLYTEGFPKTSLLYGAFDLFAQGDIVVVVEGSIDVMRLSQHGIPAVATLGTGISQEQARILARFQFKRAYLMFDRDAAGVHGIEIAERLIRKMPIFVCRYPKGRSDPAELTESEVWRSVERAVPLRKFWMAVK